MPDHQQLFADLFGESDSEDEDGPLAGSWMDPPQGYNKTTPESCSLPSLMKAKQTFTGHTKGVYSIKFIPKNGHLLLSAGLDGKIKIWDLLGTRGCLFSYHGHTEEVRFFPEDFQIEDTRIEKIQGMI